MFELVKQKLITLDKGAAFALLNKNNYACQRPMKKNHLRTLEKIIVDGMWIGGNVTIANRCFNGGEQILVNGQQTCEAVVNTGYPVKITYNEYDCHDEDDVATLYGQFDPSEGTRSLADCVRAKAYALNVGWNSTIRGRVASAVAMLEGKSRATRNEKVDLLSGYLKEGDFINSIMDGYASAKHMNRVSVYVAMILTLGKNKADAERFWIDVRDGDGLKRTQPQHKLRDYLMQVTINHGAGASVRPVTDHEMLSKCITAWNAFRKNEQTGLKYYANKPIPKAI